MLPRAEAAEHFELPADRLGDLIVVSTQHKVLGTSGSRHDLSGLTEPLRSHTSSPECSAVATAANGVASASIGRSSKCARM